MSDESQIVIPPSFIALYLPPGASRPSASRDEIAQRYEICEDLANALTQQASTLQWQLGVAHRDVLERMQAGLLDPASGLSPAEATWISRRLAELLGWEALPGLD